MATGMAVSALIDVVMLTGAAGGIGRGIAMTMLGGPDIR